MLGWIALVYYFIVVKKYGNCIITLSNINKPENAINNKTWLFFYLTTKAQLDTILLEDHKYQ